MRDHLIDSDTKLTRADSCGATKGARARRRRRRRRRRRKGAIRSLPCATGCGFGALRLRSGASARPTSGRSPWISSQVTASGNVERCSRPRWARAGRLDVDQTLLQGEDLLQPLDVAACNRQQAELDPPLERIGGEALTPADEAERLEQRAGEDGVGQRVGRAPKLRAVRSSDESSATGESGAPSSSGVISFSSPVACSWRNASSAWPERRILKYSSSSRAGALRAISCLWVVDRIEDGILDRELQPRRQHHRAQHPDRILEEPHVGIADAADQPWRADPRGRRRSR